MKGNWEKELHLVSHGRGTCKLWHNYINGIFPTKYTENFQANYKNFTCYDWNFVFLRGIIQKKRPPRSVWCDRFLHHTVDGRNPAPVHRQFIPLFARFFTSKRRLALGSINKNGTPLPKRWFFQVGQKKKLTIAEGNPPKKNNNELPSRFGRCVRPETSQTKTNDGFSDGSVCHQDLRPLTKVHSKPTHQKGTTSGQITIIPKPEKDGLCGGIPLLNHHWIGVTSAVVFPVPRSVHLRWQVDVFLVQGSDIVGGNVGVPRMRATATVGPPPYLYPNTQSMVFFAYIWVV